MADNKGGNVGQPVDNTGGIIVGPTTVITPGVPDEPVSKFVPVTVVNIATTGIASVVANEQVPVGQPVPVRYGGIAVPRRGESRLVDVTVTSFREPDQSPVVEKATATPTCVAEAYYEPDVVDFPNSGVQSASSIKQSYPRSRKD